MKPGETYEDYWKRIMEVSRDMVLRQRASVEEARKLREQQRREVEALALLREVDPYFRFDTVEVQKSDPATAEALREVADLLRQLLDRPQAPPQVVVNVSPEIVAHLLPHSTHTTVERNDRGGITGSTTKVIS